MTVTTKIRRQGGAAIITLPAAVLKSIRSEIGDDLALTVIDDGLLVKRVNAPRRRYTLSELLEGAEDMAAMNASVNEAMDGDPIGNEA
ncbi:AbrB/MazE/SpoVT family DNA-binding domain-containing protein [Rhizobium sp. YIM 134829]|uniref:AbrB/MazE/SpoVT family DNA-binding domain-containing protein n=1 Tax=Rhizobium sp. YIM 134829 TaxID=3390453 RepID=UPI00397E12AF